MDAKKVTDNIEREFWQVVRDTKRASTLYGKIISGSVTYAEVEEMASISGKAMGEIIIRHLMELYPDGRILLDDAIALIPPGLRTNYDFVAKAIEAAQKAVNEAAGVGLKVVIPKFDHERAEGLAKEMATSEDIAEMVRRFPLQVQNNSLCIVDDAIRQNARAHNRAGLEVKVTRVYDDVGVHNGKDVCAWCLVRCGKDMPYQVAYEKGAFQRHPGCGCVIEYISQKGIRTYQTGKSGPNDWISEEEFRKRVDYGLGGRKLTPQERNINAAIEMQVRDKRSITLVNAIIDNHEGLKNYTPATMLQRLTNAGYNIEPLSQSKSGFNGKSFEDGGGYKVLFGGDGIFRYHPKGGRHKIEYWTVANSVNGEHRYGMDGKEIFIS